MLTSTIAAMSASIRPPSVRASSANSRICARRRRSADPRPASITAFNSPRSDPSSRTRHFSRLVCVVFLSTAPNSDDRWAGPGQAGSDPIRTFPRSDPVLGSGPDYRPFGLKSTLTATEPTRTLQPAIQQCSTTRAGVSETGWDQSGGPVCLLVGREPANH